MSCYQPALGPVQYLPRRYSSDLFGEALKESQSALNSSCLHMVPVFTAVVTLSTTPPPCTPPSRTARGSQENSFLRGGQRAAAEWCMGVAVAGGRDKTLHTLHTGVCWLDTAGGTLTGIRAVYWILDTLHAPPLTVSTSQLTYHRSWRNVSTNISTLRFGTTINIYL